MSELIDLAARLRQLEVGQLANLLDSIGSTSSLHDLFDLARALMGRRELEKRIRRLAKTDLEALLGGRSSARLVHECLASQDSAYPLATELATQLEPVSVKRVKQDLSSGLLTNYETQLALTELLFACERHWLQEMKTGLRAADAKSISQVLKLEVPRLQLIFQLALTCGLIGVSGERYVATKTGLNWLEEDPAERWLFIAHKIWDLPAGNYQAGNLSEQIADQYPLLDISSLQLLQFGHLIGVLDNGKTNQLFLAGQADLKNASQLVANQYPEPAKRVIVQGDLSIISPGPLSPTTHKLLDLISHSEDLGLACRFRISLNSVLHAMETGFQPKEITSLLEQLSGASLPQPISYLISQAEKKFGELTIKATESGCIVASSDQITLTQIRNEQGLTGLMLRDNQDGLSSRLAPELVYFNLRDHGYPAILIDADGEVISPRVSTTAVTAETLRPNLEVAHQLINNELRAPDVNDHVRQLQFALKNKLKVGLRVDMPEGVVEFEMTPLGISGGRFRGRDVVKEAERTLPLSRIQAVWLS